MYQLKSMKINTRYYVQETLFEKKLPLSIFSNFCIVTSNKNVWRIVSGLLLTVLSSRKLKLADLLFREEKLTGTYFVIRLWFFVQFGLNIDTTVWNIIFYSFSPAMSNTLVQIASRKPHSFAITVMPLSEPPTATQS